MQDSWYSRIEVTLAGHRRLVLILLLATAVLLRVVFFSQANSNPFFTQHSGPNSDMNFFDKWAQEIAGGDWLGSKPLHPHHHWHAETAEAYFKQNPDSQRAYLEQSGQDKRGAARLLWDDWYGSKSFHQAPLYPYAMALSYLIFNRDVRWVFLWQSVLSVLSLLVLYRMTYRIFGDLAALAAGVAACLYGPFLFYDFQLLRVSLIIFSGLTLWLLVDLSFRKEQGRWWFLTGICCGLAILIKATYLLMPALVLCGVLIIYRAESQKMLKSLAVLLIGLTISLTPLVARNLSEEVPALALSSVGAITFINSNHSVNNSGFYHYYPYESAQIMGKTDGRFLPSVVATLGTQKDLSQYLMLTWRKFANFFHWYENPDNANYHFYQARIFPLRITLLSFAFLAPFIILGMGLALPQWRTCWFLYLLVASLLTPMLVFYPQSRFRVPFVIMALPFAGLGFAGIIRYVTERRLWKLLFSLSLIFTLMAWGFRPLPEQMAVIRPVDYVEPYVTHFSPRLDDAMEKGEWQKAEIIIKKALSYAPPGIWEVARGGELLLDAQMLRVFALYSTLLSRYMEVLLHLDEEEDAFQIGLLAVVLNPENLDLFYLKAQEAINEQRCAEGSMFLKIVEKFYPQYPDIQIMKMQVLKCADSLN